MQGDDLFRMLFKWPISYPAFQGKEKRNVYVYVPDAAKDDPELRFPVLYMFDGHNLFLDEEATYGKSWGLKEYLDEHKVPLIVVGIECSHHAEDGRLSEYSPFDFSFDRLGHVTGRGQQTMDWFVKSLKPRINRLYPTLRGRAHTFIAGSSMGGLMSLYAVIKYNRVFSRAAALSPSLWVAPKEMKHMIHQAKLQSGTVVYMDYGQKEMRNHEPMAQAFGETCTALLQKQVLLTSRIVPGGTHCEASWEKQIPFFINTLLYQHD